MMDFKPIDKSRYEKISPIKEKATEKYTSHIIVQKNMIADPDWMTTDVSEDDEDKNYRSRNNSIYQTIPNSNLTSRKSIKHKLKPRSFIGAKFK